MVMEIERKFLLANQDWRTTAAPPRHLLQGYLSSTPRCTVRVRVDGDNAWLTIKGCSDNISRVEYEYPVPVEDARQMLRQMCATVVEKRRYLVEYAGHTWEIDEFLGDNNGLIVAEIELNSEQEKFIRPPWLGREVSGAIRYYNSHLAHTPYCDWSAAEKQEQLP